MDKTDNFPETSLSSYEKPRVDSVGFDSGGNYTEAGSRDMDGSGDDYGTLGTSAIE